MGLAGWLNCHSTIFVGITLYRLGTLPKPCICLRERERWGGGGEARDEEAGREGGRRRGRGTVLPTVSLRVLVRLRSSRMHMSACQ